MIRPDDITAAVALGLIGAALAYLWFAGVTRDELDHWITDLVDSIIAVATLAGIALGV